MDYQKKYNREIVCFVFESRREFSVDDIQFIIDIYGNRLDCTYFLGAAIEKKEIYDVDIRNKFLKKINGLSIFSWKKLYTIETSHPGFGWTIILHYRNGDKKEIFGNIYPKGLMILLEILYEYFHEEFSFLKDYVKRR